MMDTRRQAARLAMVAGMVSAFSAMAAYDVRWQSVDAGSAVTAGGGFTLTGTVGQPDAGMLVGGGYDLAGGFWPGLAGSGVPGPGDCDGDGDVDLSDFDEMALCLLGPGQGLAQDCACFDLDQDGDVTLVDFALMQVSFTSS